MDGMQDTPVDDRGPRSGWGAPQQVMKSHASREGATPALGPGCGQTSSPHRGPHLPAVHHQGDVSGHLCRQETEVTPAPGASCVGTRSQVFLEVLSAAWRSTPSLQATPLQLLMGGRGAVSAAPGVRTRTGLGLCLHAAPAQPGSQKTRYKLFVNEQNELGPHPTYRLRQASPVVPPHPCAGQGIQLAVTPGSGSTQGAARPGACPTGSGGTQQGWEPVDPSGALPQPPQEGRAAPCPAEMS